MNVLVYKMKKEDFPEIRSVAFDLNYCWESSGTQQIFELRMDSFFLIDYTHKQIAIAQLNEEYLIADFFNINNEELIYAKNKEEVYYFLKNGEIKKKPDYSSKELIYEAKSELNDYTFIIFNAENQEEYINAQKVAFSNEFSWGYDGTNEVDYDNYAFTLVFRIDSKIIIDVDPYGEEMRYGNIKEYLINEYMLSDNDIFETDEIEELKNLFKTTIKPDYSSRELVYENKNSAEESQEIAIIVHNDEELIKLIGIYSEFYPNNVSKLDHLLHVEEDKEFIIFLYYKKEYRITEYKINYANIQYHLLDGDPFGYGTFDGVYEKIFDFSNDSDIKKVYDILKTKEIKNKPNYGKKELVYENNEEKMLYLFSPQNDKEVIEAQDIAYECGWKWEGIDSNIKHYVKYVNECFSLTFRYNKVITYSSSGSYPKILDYYPMYKKENIHYTTDIFTLKKWLTGKQAKPDYGKRELIYENRNTAELCDEICILVDNKEELTELRDIYIKYYNGAIDSFNKLYFINNNYPRLIFLFYKQCNDVTSMNYSSNTIDRYNIIGDNVPIESGAFHGVYEKIFDFSKSTDKEIIENAFKNKKINIRIPNYNKSKELIYENNNDNLFNKINSYHKIHIKCNTDEEVIRYQKILYKYGINWGIPEKEPKYTKRSECYYLEIDVNDKIIYKTNYNIIEIHYKYTHVMVDDLYINNSKDFDNFFNTKPDYNTPKELIYENNNKSNTSNTICVLINTQEELEKISNVYESTFGSKSTFEYYKDSNNVKFPYFLFINFEEKTRHIKYLEYGAAINIHRINIKDKFINNKMFNGVYNKLFDYKVENDVISVNSILLNKGFPSEEKKQTKLTFENKLLKFNGFMNNDK